MISSMDYKKIVYLTSFFNTAITCCTHFEFIQQGICDDDIQEIDYTTSNLNEMEDVANLLITCYVNIAVAAMKGHMYAMVIEACDEVLKHDPNHVKSLFLKSKALVIPKSSGAAEDELAVRNLKLALKSDPNNKIVM